MRKRINDLYNEYCVEKRHSEFFIVDSKLDNYKQEIADLESQSTEAKVVVIWTA